MKVSLQGQYQSIVSWLAVVFVVVLATAGCLSDPAGIDAPDGDSDAGDVGEPDDAGDAGGDVCDCPDSEQWEPTGDTEPCCDETQGACDACEIQVKLEPSCEGDTPCEMIETDTYRTVAGGDCQQCPEEQCTDWGPCTSIASNDSCDEDGIRHRLCWQLTCSQGQCERIDDSQSAEGDACHLETDGFACEDEGTAGECDDGRCVECEDDDPSCGCEPLSHSEACHDSDEVECGEVSDGCGGTHHCGVCAELGHVCQDNECCPIILGTVVCD